MLDNLLNLVKEFSGEAIVNNPAIPNNRNEEVIADATQSIQGGFQDLLSQGKINDVLRFFGGDSNPAAQSGITEQISGNLIQSLIGKFGIDKQAAGGIASSLIPGILSSLVSRTNNSNDSSFNIQSLLNSFSGGKTANINVQGLLDKFKGGSLDIDGDGDTDLQDLMGLLGKR